MRTHLVNGQDPQSGNQIMNHSFGIASANDADAFTSRFSGVGSQRLSCFTKIYKVIRLRSSIIIVKKYYPVSLQHLVPCLIKNKDLHKKFLRSIVLALENLFNTLQKFQIEHGNLKLSNCFLRLQCDADGPSKLKVVVGDPHLPLMFEEASPDSEAIADMIHTFICGRPPVKIPDYKRMIHQSAKNSAYYQLIQFYYELADGLISLP